jgi:hypothetical protein
MELIEREKDELEAYKGKWVNVQLSTNGQVISHLVHDSKEAAFRRFEEWLAEAEGHFKERGVPHSIVIGDVHQFYYPTEYITTIQMPYKE